MDEARRMLKVYRAIDNDHRLNILAVLSNEPGISFNDLAKRIGINRGLLAYHLGVLKRVRLVRCEYERRSKKFTRYWLTEEGMEIVRKFKLNENDEATSIKV